MPILLIFLVTAACLDRAPWPNPLQLSPALSAVFTGSTVLLLLTAAFRVRTRVRGQLQQERSLKHAIASAYSASRRRLFFVNLGAVALAVLLFGWARTVHDTCTVVREGRVVLAPFAELLVPLPYFLVMLGCWSIYFDAERALHALASPSRSFWSRSGYVVNHLRQLALMVGLPVGLFVAQQTLARTEPEITRADWYRIASFATVPVLLVLMPLLIKPLLGLQSLPEGPLRDRFEALARRLGFRYTDLLLWPTKGSAVNAMIVGLVPQARYVIFTDRILEEMPEDELEAVLGHEVGHAKHGHIWFYAAFLLLSMTVLAVGGWILEVNLRTAALEHPDVWYAEYLLDDSWMALPPLALAAGYIFLVFGFLSRRCERQADVYGCRAVSCADRHCDGHDNATIYPLHAKGLCRTGIHTFVRGLERVKLLSGIDEAEHSRSVGGRVRALAALLRAWLHSTIARRVNFLLSLLDDPEREQRFQHRVRLLRWGLLGSLIVALLALGTTVGWNQLIQAL